MSTVQFGAIDGLTFSDPMSGAPSVYAPMPAGTTTLECSICGEEVMIAPMSLRCGHTYCLHCIWRWVTSVDVYNRPNDDCPTCR